MAFRGGMRRALNGAVLGLSFAGAGAASFYFFEDIYRAIEQQWPRLDSSLAPAVRDEPQVVASTSPLKGPSDPFTDPAFGVAGLRSSLTDLTPAVAKAARPGRSVTLAANSYGHFVVDAEINGAKVELLTDTGATYVALNYQTALALGFNSQTMRFTSRSTTANGIARVAPVNLDYLRIGSIVVRDVKAVIAEPGKMTQNLLGMSFINRLAGFELKGGQLVMLQSTAP
jgi:clan AA aspartic protease (TIGR02281 family)